MGFEGSYLWRLRRKIGSELVVVPGAQVLVIDSDDRLLLIRRSDTGRWGLPAGSAEPHSTFALTAVRELEEETGLRAEVADLEPFACVSNPDRYAVTYPNGDQVHAFALCFAVRTWTGALHPLDGEALDLRFFTDLPDQRHDQVDETLRLWHAYGRTGRFQVA
ncbi:NUDIX domain-containing protein [Actinopolymorpha sp. B17G11]|uniref:NUDIX domain-containing protein n=1 Tax=unclassified Actinopolymorpha TaxID=2627063 RepID=UPI0032D97971